MFDNTQKRSKLIGDRNIFNKWHLPSFTVQFALFPLNGLVKKNSLEMSKEEETFGKMRKLLKWKENID